MSNLQDPRVFLALERTLLAWNRSSLGLTAFGFLLERSSLLIHVLEPTQNSPKVALSKWFSVLIVLLAVVISLFSIRQYKVALKSLNPSEMIVGYRTDLPVMLGLINILCAAMLFVIFFV